MPFHVTVLYAGINGLIILVLALNVVRLRRNTRVGLGDGGNDDMLRACRMHANATEYVPIVLILMGLLAWSWAPSEMFRVSALFTDWRNMAEFGRAFLHPNFHDWDICAGHILVEEAGGRATGLRGQEIRYGLPGARQRHGLLATNGVLHEAALAGLSEPAA